MMRLGVTSPFNKSFSISSVPIGQKGLVHIWGQNNTTLEQKLGISWVVNDPDGLLVELYPREKDIEWSGDIKPGTTHHFLGGRFEFFKEGVYTIDVSLFMNPDSPVIVNDYKGVLCTVVVEVPPVPPDEEVPEEINWLPIILIGGGVTLAAVALMPKKK